MFHNCNRLKSMVMCQDVDPCRTRPNPQPPIPGNSRDTQRVQDFWYNNLVAARCKSHQNPKGVRTNGTHAHTTQHRGCRHGGRNPKMLHNLMNEQEPQSPQSPNARPPGTPNQTMQSPDPSLFCTLSSTATHPAQRSSPEDSLVHASD